MFSVGLTNEHELPPALVVGGSVKAVNKLCTLLRHSAVTSNRATVDIANATRCQLGVGFEIYFRLGAYILHRRGITVVHIPSLRVRVSEA